MIFCQIYSNFANSVLGLIEGTPFFDVLLPLFQGLWDIFFVPILGCPV